MFPLRVTEKEAVVQPILVRSLAEHAYLREHLLAEYREAIDEETLRDTLEGLSSLPRRWRRWSGATWMT